MKINQLSSVNAGMHFTRNCAFKHQNQHQPRSIAFKGSLTEKAADSLINGALIVTAGIFKGLSSLFSSNAEEKESETNYGYNEPLDVWHMGDATM